MEKSQQEKHQGAPEQGPHSVAKWDVQWEEGVSVGIMAGSVYISLTVKLVSYESQVTAKETH